MTVSDGRESVEKVWKVVVGNKKIVETVEEPVEPEVPPMVFNSYAIDG